MESGNELWENIWPDEVTRFGKDVYAVRVPTAYYQVTRKRVQYFVLPVFILAFFCAFLGDGWLRVISASVLATFIFIGILQSALSPRRMNHDPNRKRRNGCGGCAGPDDSGCADSGDGGDGGCGGCGD